MTIANVWRRIRHFVQRDRISAELREEMQLHIDLRAEQLARAHIGSGGTRHDAQRQFGNQTLIAEEGRNMSGFAWVEHALQDIHLAAHRIRKHSAFAAAVVGVMGLGIGAAAVMFSAVDAAMLRPLPFAHPSELVWLRDVQVPFDPGTGVQGGAIHMLDVHDVEEMKDLFTASATYAAGGLNLADDTRPVRVNAGVVTVNFFNTLGVLPERGRMFAAEEGRPGAAKVVIISNTLWREYYGARDVTNLTISLNGTAYRVVGVMPGGFRFPRESDLWIPMSVPSTFASFAAFRNSLPSETIARLAPDVSPAVAEQQLRARWQKSLSPGAAEPVDQNAKSELADIRAKGASLPLQQQLVGDKSRALLILLGATALLLVIACANVTNLLLSQAAVRRREMALREALGATRNRLVRQLLVESVVLALIGAALGVALAPAGLRVVGKLMPPILADVSPARVDLRVLAFAAVVAVVTGIVFGLWPALSTRSDSLDSVIKTGASYGSTSGALGKGRRILVATELALTVILLIGAGLFQRSFNQVMGLDRGMITDHVASLEVGFPKLTRAAEMQRVNEIITALMATPGIVSVGAVNDLPLRGGPSMSLTINPYGSGRNMSMVRYLIASSGYFGALGIRLIDGRQFAVTDDSLAPSVVLVSATMARTFWPGKNAIGETFDLMGKPITVIGIVADVRETSLEKTPLSQMYFPMAQKAPANIALVARGTLPPAAMLSLLTNAVHGADHSQAVYNVRMMEQVVGNSVVARRTNVLLISIFAGVALVLSSLGVFAVVAYGVTQRARELGIRAALGARRSNLVSLVAGELLGVSVLGICAGLGAAWLASKLVSSMLYGVSPHDGATFVAVPLFLLLPVAIAAIVPAYRAARVNPSTVLRTD